MSEVLNTLKEHKQELFKKYPIKTLGLFGSYSRGDFKESSDVDVLADFNQPVGIEFIRLSHDLEDILSKNVDLVSRNSIKDKYMKIIQRDLLYV